ncbi:MAG: hypothetical protein RBU37_16190 [Myxococcota bacterium]|jgi:hypothetical protein|nr:hypothetical protein [Myxococcota bacterium]
MPRLALPILLITMLTLACSEEKAPKLLPLSAQTVIVNETLNIALEVDNPDGLALSYTVDAPKLPSFDEVTSISGSPGGGQFRWTPLSSHVGSHELTFTISSSAGKSSQSVLVEVQPAQSAAPIFLRPGFGGTFDLTRDPCVRFDIEVRDDDTLELEIRPGAPMPEGAELVYDELSSKRAHFEWCPSEAQVQRTLRWPISLLADDAQHPPTPHDYLIVLRTATKSNCDGDAPSVTVTAPESGQTIASPGGYLVNIQVADDKGVRDAPILYYTTSDLPDEATATDFDAQLGFEEGSKAGEWIAVVPPLDLPEGKEQVIYWMVSVTDNDDPSGTTCDHTTETPVAKFFAKGVGPNVKANVCDACTASSQCASGICSVERGGRCLAACNDCTKGSCEPTTTVDAASVDACGPVSVVCGGGTSTECTNDGAEPNDAIDDATPLSGNTSGTICPGDVDLFAYAAEVDTTIQVQLSGFTTGAGDLDLGLYDLEGQLLVMSATDGEQEAVGYCVRAGESVVVGVFPYRSDGQSPYSIALTTTPGKCCENDSFEPDNSFDTARPVGSDGSFEGTICPFDVDIVSFEITEPQNLEATVVFDANEIDIDLELYGPDDAFIVGAWNDGDTESLIQALATPGVYKLAIVPYGSGEAEYVGMVELSELGDCANTKDCPLFNVCSGGECVSDSCQEQAQCPSAHVCAKAGPSSNFGYCSASCTSNTQCRDTEACKWFVEGRGCGQAGTGQNGDACSFFENCGAQRTCVAWTGGYCARVGCQSNADCESNTFCSSVAGLNVCVRRCGGAEPPCRLAEGYACTELSVVGGGQDQGCVKP